MVRSMAQPSNPQTSPSESRHQSYSSNTDIQVQAAETTNDSPTAAIPIPYESSDLEQGDDMAATLVNDDEAQSSASGSRWAGLPSMSLGAFSGQASGRKTHEDRDR